MKTNKAIAFSYAEEGGPMQSTKDLDNLHSTLPIAELISLLELEISEIISYDSFEYAHPLKSIHVFRGSPKLHQCHYKIHTSDFDLGRVTLTRKRPFSEDEMLSVEKALGALSIHISNAFDFQASMSDEQLMALKVESELHRLG